MELRHQDRCARGEGDEEDRGDHMCGSRSAKVFEKGAVEVLRSTTRRSCPLSPPVEVPGKPKRLSRGGVLESKGGVVCEGCVPSLGEKRSKKKEAI